MLEVGQFVVTPSESAVFGWCLVFVIAAELALIGWLIRNSDHAADDWTMLSGRQVLRLFVEGPSVSTCTIILPRSSGCCTSSYRMFSPLD